MSKTTSVDDIYSLSPLQQGILFHTLYSPRSGAYLEQMSCKIKGELDAVAFRRAWQEVVDRHAILRTAFFWERRDVPLQVVRKRVALPWDEYDWREFPAAEQERRLEEFLEADRVRAFDLTKAPLMRFAVIRVADDVRHFIWNSHHLLLDGWSQSIVLKEAFTYYEALRKGRELPRQRSRSYKDYIGWLRQQDRAKAEAFWRQALKGFDSPTAISIDRPAQPVSGDEYEYAEQQINLSRQATADLQARAQQHGLTLNTFAQGGWALLLSRYSGEQDVLFGAVVSGRPATLPGVESMVGLFVNTLPVRAKVAPQANLLSWLKSLQETLLEMRQYEYSSLVEVQGWSEVPRGVSLFTSLFVFENYPIKESLQEGVGLEFSDLRLSERTNYPLAVLATPGPEMSVQVDYDANRFSPPAISRMLGHLKVMLEAMAANPDRSLSDLPMLAEAERDQLLFEWNDTRAEYLPVESIKELFEAQVERTPEAVAVICDGHHLTYSELNRRANQLAHHLLEMGLDEDLPLGIWARPTIETTVAIVGSIKSGKAYVPLAPSYPDQRLAFMIEDSRAELILARKDSSERLPRGGPRAVYLDADWDRIATRGGQNPQREIQGQATLYIIYTSGSTGRPKGVLLAHHSLSNMVQWQLRNWTPPSPARTLQFAPLSFDVSCQEMLSTWCSGGALVLVDEDLRRDPFRLWPFMNDNSVERLFLPFVALQGLAEAAYNGCAPAPSLREVITAGEQLQSTPQVRRLFEELEGSVLRNQYGPTEAHVGTEYMLCGPPAGWAAFPPIGRPIGNAQMYVLDAQLNPLPVGVAGELYIGGRQVANGYVDRPDLTAEKFLPNPYDRKACSRIYRTGDRARYLEDGNIEFLGRIDFQVKIRGFRIEPGEIEAALAGHEAVSEAVVMAFEDAAGGKRLVGYVSARQGASAAAGELKSYLKERLPEYMVPSAIVMLDRMPLTPSGKVDRKALSLLSVEGQGRAEGYTPPRTPVEGLLAGIWGDVLGLEQVNVNDNFFDLGGHSLIAIKMISRIREAFQIELPFKTLFEAPVLADLAGTIQAAIKTGVMADVPPIRPSSRDANPPLSFAQQRMWLLNQFESNSPVYNIHDAIRFEGSLDMDALVKAINEIVRRHDVFRTTFEPVDGSPVQVISPARWQDYPVLDLTRLPEPEREAEMARLANVEARLPFDLSKDAMLRVTLLRLGDEHHAALFNMHHIISDAWSMDVLIDELTSLYEAFSNDIPSPLDDLPVQYADYAIWQRHCLREEVIEAELDYWRQHLDGASALLDLPTDRPRPALQTFSGTSLPFELGQDMAGRLKRLSRREGVTLFMTLLAAFQTLLHRYSGQGDIVVGVPVSGRSRAEIEGLIGFFVNTLALRVEVEGDASFKQLLRKVKEMVLGGFAHQEVPFEKLVETLRPERSLSHTPLFQVAFSLQESARPLELPGLKLSHIESDSGTAQFDLTLRMTDVKGALVGELDFNTDLFEKATISVMRDHFLRLLESVVSNPEQQLSRISFLTEAEREQLVVEWNQTASDFPAHLCIHQLFQQQAALTPDLVAISFNDLSVTYSQLDRRTNQLARHLQSLGVGPEVRVAVCLPRGADLIVALLGTLKAGGAYVPLDATYPLDRLSYMLEDSGAPILITDEVMIDSAPARWVQTVLMDGDRKQIERQSEEATVNQAQPENVCYVIYTSGTTGKPKGVSVAHKSVVRLVKAVNYVRLNQGEAMTQMAPVSFDASTFEIWGGLLNGMRIEVMSERRLTVEEIGEAVRERGVSVMWLTSGLFNVMVEEGVEWLRGVDQLLAGGDVLSVRHVEKAVKEVSGMEVINGYGPTESTTFASTYRVRGGEWERGSVPIGRPITNTEMYVMNEALELAGIGVRGELHIGGAGLARGYEGDAMKTAEKFIPDPFGKEGGRLYRTGDVVRHRADGEIEFIGRNDEQVKIRGYRIEPGEIESVLGGHGGVKEAVVIADRDAGEKRLVGYVVAKQEAGLTAVELKKYLAERLPEYMVPSAFVFLEEMPLTPNGKLNRRALPDPGDGGISFESERVDPRTPVEEVLAGLWVELLQVKGVGVTDNFFDTGGHSLLAMQMVSRLREWFQLEVPLRQVFESPTIEGLAQAMTDDPAGRVKVEKTAEILLKLSRLTEDEAQALLGTQLEDQQETQAR